MYPRLLSFLLTMLLFGALPPAWAAEVHDADVQVAEVAEAPFAVDVLQAQWQGQDDGSYVLAIEYSVTNLGKEPLASLGWTLGVETGNGAPKSSAQVTRSGTVETGETSTGILVLHEKSLGGFDPSDSITFAGSSSSSRRCAGGDVDCAQIQFACEQSCNNPLGTNRGVKRFECGPCQWVYDQQRDCWSKQCNFNCECGDIIWPDQMPAIDEFTNWDDLLGQDPGNPPPF